MKRLYYAALGYLVLGLLAGLYYREFTKANDFTGKTQLSVVHTHLLALGLLLFLVLIALESSLKLSEGKLFGWFFWVYNAGLLWTVGMLVVNGTRTVLGHPTGAALAGISGLGHIGLSAGLVLLFVCLHSRLFGAEGGTRVGTDLVEVTEE